jgi:asparagine synthase (glutamine-hydrolysing)
MCGIYGILSLENVIHPQPDILSSMGNITIHRGPDDEGTYSDDKASIGMRRLSIIDLSGGHQPISNEDEKVWVVCNGEIYNFRELRKDLKSKGHRFRTASDTEVLVHLYEEYDEKFIEKLNGMFGFALWDSRKSKMLIGRDRLGIKPIYYYLDESQLIFASEAKAILSHPDVDTELDHTALQQYLTLGYVPAPYSIFAGIKKLPVASLMICKDNNIAIERYWELNTTPDGSLTEQEWCDLVLEKLEKAVVGQMVSDVPLGAFLSGGIDSSTVVALMAKNNPEPIKTYSIGFDTGKAGAYYNELPYAKKVSQLFQTKHKEIIVKPDVIELLPKLLWHMDEPIADTAFITTFLVAEFARQDVKVILSGVGGDELFGGYRRYLGDYYNRYYKLIPSWVRQNILLPLAKNLPADRHSGIKNLSRHMRSFIQSSELRLEDRYRFYIQVFSQQKLGNLLKDQPKVHYDALNLAFDQVKGGDELSQLFEVDLGTQLPDDLLLLTDKMTMATSLECRVPLLDHELVELGGRMPSHLKINGRQLKYVLKKALKEVLPADILYRKKRGFGAPMGAWLKQELAPLMKHILSEDSISSRGLFNWPAIQETIKLHENDREDHTDHLLSLMNLELWCRMYLDGFSAADLSDQIKSELNN